jgi:hypothetical protein
MSETSGTDIRWLGAKLLLCRECEYRQLVNIELLPDGLPLPLLASKFECPNCRQNGAHVLPNWETAPNEPSPGQDQELVRNGNEEDHPETD